jgi:hypothetical protein
VKKCAENARGPEAFASGPRHENRSAHVLADSSSAKTASNFGLASAGELLVARPAIVASDVSAS